MKVTLVKHPDSTDWMLVKECALVTIGKEANHPPSMEWMQGILKARHSPIRELRFVFKLEGIPYWVSTHLVRHHVGFQAYVRSQRNDRQELYDRASAPQDAPVDMMISLNADALISLAQKRLCNQASLETRAVVRNMCRLVEVSNPEFIGVLKPICEWQGGICNEMKPCERKKLVQNGSN